jgi:hypothetical protein
MENEIRFSKSVEKEEETPNPLVPLREADKEVRNLGSVWTDDQEEVLKNISHNAGLMSEDHKSKYKELISSLSYYKIPIIILSSLNGIFSVGLNTYMKQEIVSTITCLISFLVSSISSVELFLSIQRRSDQELMSYKQFYALSVKINTTLVLHKKHRQGDGDTFLTQVLGEYNSLFESACVNGLGNDDKLIDIRVMPSDLVFRS